MAKKNQKMWVLVTPKQPKPKVSEEEKQLVLQKCNELIESEFKTKYIELPPTDNARNYLVDIFGKWYRNYFYFCDEVKADVMLKLTFTFTPAIAHDSNELATLQQALNRNPVDRLSLTARVSY